MIRLFFFGQRCTCDLILKGKMLKMHHRIKCFNVLCTNRQRRRLRLAKQSEYHSAATNWFRQLSLETKRRAEVSLKSSSSTALTQDSPLFSSTRNGWLLTRALSLVCTKHCLNRCFFFFFALITLLFSRCSVVLRKVGVCALVWQKGAVSVLQDGAWSSIVLFFCFVLVRICWVRINLVSPHGNPFFTSCGKSMSKIFYNLIRADLQGIRQRYILYLLRKSAYNITYI